MDEDEYKRLKGILTYLVIFTVVSVTSILRFYDKISPDLTGVIFGFILGVMMSILHDIQKDLLKKGE